MPETLTVRVYNVRFGDAILVTVPDEDPATHVVTKRRILIDVGNAPTVASPEGGADAVFEAAILDILDQLGDDPLDLYVMTHEHLDHAQGLPHAAWKLPAARFQERFRVRHVWLTASSAPGYYDAHPEAKKKKLAFDAMYERIRSYLQLHAVSGSAGLLGMLANNDPTKTKECVDFLRRLNPDATTYVYRGVPLADAHPFREATFEIWAPEEDTSDYYGTFQPLALADGEAVARVGGVLRDPAPPAGVDVGAFMKLVGARRAGIADNLLAIDKAANNTSIVFLLEWRGWRLLFAGDAELRSWKTMQREGVLKPVHFLKVSHHGSHNGTPAGEAFDRILPPGAPDAAERKAAISTWTDTYPGIPHSPTNERLKTRARLRTTLDDRTRPYFDLEFPG